jgi:hypothetical protein
MRAVLWVLEINLIGFSHRRLKQALCNQVSIVEGLHFIMGDMEPEHLIFEDKRDNSPPHGLVQKLDFWEEQVKLGSICRIRSKIFEARFWAGRKHSDYRFSFQDFTSKRSTDMRCSVLRIIAESYQVTDKHLIKVNRMTGIITIFSNFIGISYLKPDKFIMPDFPCVTKLLNWNIFQVLKYDVNHSEIWFCKGILSATMW